MESKNVVWILDFAFQVFQVKSLKIKYKWVTKLSHILHITLILDLGSKSFTYITYHSYYIYEWWSVDFRNNSEMSYTT